MKLTQQNTHVFQCTIMRYFDMRDKKVPVDFCSFSYDFFNEINIIYSLNYFDI